MISHPSFFFFLLLKYLLPLSFFFFNDTAPTEIYPLSLPAALPISIVDRAPPLLGLVVVGAARVHAEVAAERPHVAQRRRGDRGHRRRQRRIAPGDERMARHVVEQRGGANAKRSPVVRRVHARRARSWLRCRALSRAAAVADAGQPRDAHQAHH